MASLRATMAAATPHGAAPRLRIVKGDEVLISNELDGATGGVGPYPDARDVVPVIAMNDDPATCALLQETARQVFRQGPMDRLAEWGDHLLCSVPGSGRVDVGGLKDLHKTNQRGVCGKTFKKGDICWNCRHCESDSTCVQCDACFRASDHTGHDVYFHAASPGGCCDCGDLEAWKLEGCCPAHSGPDLQRDPIENLPPQMVGPARAVFREAVALVTDACCHAVQGFNRAEHHPLLASPPKRPMSAYDFYVEAERDRVKAELDAHAMPQQVLEVLAHRWREMGDAAHAPYEQLAAQDEARHERDTAAWERTPCVVRLHNDDVHTFQQVTDALLALQLPSASARTLTERVDADGHALVKRGSPGQLRHALASLAEEGLLVSMVDEAQVEREERAARVLGWLTRLATQVDGLARAVAELLTEAYPLSLAQMGFEKGTKWCTPLLRVHQPAPDDNGLNLSSEDASLRLSDARLSSRLALLMVADFFLVKRLRTELHALYLHLLVDAHFKPALAKALTWAYPILNGLYSRGVGTHEDSLFSFSVQLYTTPSIVRWLATTTADEERLGSPGLMTVLTEAMLQAMRVAGWREGQTLTERFWEHHLVQHRRFSHILRDLDYSLQTQGTATALLELAYPGPGPRPLAAWMTLLGALQHADPFVRKTGAHIEFESAVWTAAFTLSLPLYSTCAALVSNGLKSHVAAHGSSSDPEQGDGEGGDEEAAMTPAEAEEERAARLRAYASVAQAAARGILAWLDRKGQSRDLFRLVPHAYEETGTGMKAVRPQVDFRLHAEPVSFHLPLHRFLAAAVLEGAAQGLGLPQLELESTELFAALLAEFPLRCLALTAQVNAGLWRRNGLSVQGQAVHYASTPFCKVFRDLDLAALQLSVLLGGNELVLGLLLDRFLLARWALEPDYVAAPSPREPFDPKEVVVLAEEALLALILLVTEVPGPAGGTHRDAALRRELVHRLACKEGLTHSEAHQATALADGEAADPGVSTFDSILAGVATRRAAGEDAASRFDLKPECALEYDPAFFHMSRQEHEAAVERVLAMRKTLKRRQQQDGSSGACPQPAVGPPPLAHEAFAPVRLLLYWPEVLAFQHTVLHAAATPTGSKSPAAHKRSAMLLVRCLHLVSLQLHCHKDALRLEEEACRVEPPALKAYQLREDRPVRDFFAALAQPRPLKGAAAASQEVAAGEEQKQEAKEGPSMLALLAQLARDSQGLNVGPLFEEGLQWALGELSDQHLARFPAGSGAEAVLKGFGASADEGDRSGSGGGGGGAKGRKASRSQQAKKAQAKALSFLKQQQSKFWEEQMAAEEAAGAEGEEEGGAAAAKEEDPNNPSLEVGAPACLYCHERTGAAMGYIGFAQRSTALAQAVAETEEQRHGAVGRRYRVSHRECLVRAGPELDSAEVTRLPRGTGLVVEEKRGRRLRVTQPVAGWVSEFTADQSRLVEPMRRYCFQQWGRTRLAVTLCGHAVHQDCWDAYYASLISEDRFDGRHALDVNRREFLCPLCKTLSNVLVPHVPPRLHPAPTPALSEAEPASPVAALVPWALALEDSSEDGATSLRGWLRSLAEAHESQQLPDVLVRNVRRFADSLGEVLDVSWARMGLEGEEGGRGSLGSGPKKLVKALHAGWSATAYTLLLEVVNRNAGGGGMDASASGGGGAEQQDRERHRRQILAAVGALAALANDGYFLGLAVTRPLGRLLAGAPLVPYSPPGEGQRNPREEAMRALPLALVLEHEVMGEEGTADGLPLERLRALHRARRAHGEPGIIEAWPLLERPLLAHDLSTLAVGALSLARQEAGPARRLAQLLALARLAQALLEPWTPPPSSGADAAMDADSALMGLAWARWRRLLGAGSEKAGDEEAADKAIAPALERAMLSRWRPFLQLLVGLVNALDLPLSPTPQSPSGAGATVPQLLERLGLRLEDTAGEEVARLFGAWGEQYRAFARQIPHLWPEDALKAAAAAAPAVPEPTVISTPAPAVGVGAAGTSAAVSGVPAAPVPVHPPTPPAMEEEEEEEDSVQEESEDDDEDVEFEIMDEDEDESDAEEDDDEMEEVEDGEVGSVYAVSPPSYVPYVPVAPGAPPPYAFHCAPYLSLLDGAATAADAQGQWMPTPTNSSGAPLPLHDLSHLGVSDEVCLRLVTLPQHYTELYTLLKEQYWALNATLPGAAGASSGAAAGGGGALTSGPTRGLEDPAICLVCGAVLAAGPRTHGGSRLSGPGVCTLHARACGSGAGVMLLVNKGSTLLFRDSRAIFYPSVYVDQYGEDDPNLRRGRPLSLSQARYDRLTQLYRQHGAAKEVTGRRLTADRVVRENYY